jgi:hypothetical protein
MDIGNGASTTNGVESRGHWSLAGIPPERTDKISYTRIEKPESKFATSQESSGIQHV